MPRLAPMVRGLGPERSERLLRPLERSGKGLFFDCRMCGQCVLGHTGMACPMNCAKQLRNGPCGGVRANGNCEVLPDMKCVWVAAWDGSQRIPGGVESFEDLDRFAPQRRVDPLEVRLLQLAGPEVVLAVADLAELGITGSLEFGDDRILTAPVAIAPPERNGDQPGDQPGQEQTDHEVDHCSLLRRRSGQRANRAPSTATIAPIQTAATTGLTITRKVAGVARAGLV